MEEATYQTSDKFQMAYLRLAKIPPISQRVLGGRVFCEYPRAEAVKVINDMESSNLSHFIAAIQFVENSIYRTKRQSQTMKM